MFFLIVLILIKEIWFNDDLLFSCADAIMDTIILSFFGNHFFLLYNVNRFRKSIIFGRPILGQSYH